MRVEAELVSKPTSALRQALPWLHRVPEALVLLVAFEPQASLHISPVAWEPLGFILGRVNLWVGPVQAGRR